MKFLGSLFVFAILGICAVFGEPEINQYDNVFHYWISSTTMTATVMGIRDTQNTYSVTLRPYVTVEGRRYYVNQIGPAAFSNTNVRTIVVPSSIQSLNISYNAFFNARDIRSIKLNTEKVTADEAAFDKIDTLVNFEGVGAKSLADDIAKKLLQKWGLPFRNYKNVSDAEFNQTLYKLAYYVKKNFSQNDKIAYKDNAVVTLALKSGSNQGIARAYRILAKNLGYDYHDVHVGSDGGYYNWNYVYIKKDNQPYKYWYNLDICNTNFPSRYNANVFRTFEQQKTLLRSKYSSGDETYLDYYKWIVYDNEYNYPGEYYVINGEKVLYDGNYEYFYDFLVLSRYLGHMAYN